MCFENLAQVRLARQFDVFIVLGNVEAVVHGKFTKELKWLFEVLLDFIEYFVAYTCLLCGHCEIVDLAKEEDGLSMN